MKAKLKQLRKITQSRVFFVTSFIVIALILGLGASFLLDLRITRMPNASMEPELNLGERLVLRRAINPGIGDIVVYESPEDTLHIHKIVAGPGDSVEVLEDKVIVNGEESFEFIPKDQQLSTSVKQEVYELDEGEYFLLAENLEIGIDSRYWGSVETKEIKSRLWLNW